MREETRNRAKEKEDKLYYKVMGSHTLRGILAVAARAAAAFMLARCVVFGEYAPFGAAFLAAGVGTPGALPVAVGVVAGYATLLFESYGAKYIAECALIVLLSALLKLMLSPENRFFPVIIAFAGSVAVGAAEMLESGGGRIEWVLFTAEVVLTVLGAWIFRAAIDRSQGDGETRGAARFILMALALSSLGSFLIGGVSVGRSLCVLLILWKVQESGTARTGAAAGLMAGLASDMTFGYTPFFSLTMAFAGVTAGVFSRFGKLVCGLAFLTAGAAVTVWGHAVGGERYSLTSLLEYAVGTLFFLALPSAAAAAGKRLDLLSGRSAVITERQADLHTEWLRDYTYDRLYAAADAYLSVSEQTVAMKKDFSEGLIIPCIRENACTSCPKRSVCTSDGAAEKEFTLLRRRLEEKGCVETDELSEDFKEFCPACERFAYELSKIWYASRCQKNYNARINEGLEMLARQYESICTLLGRTSQSLKDDCLFDYRMETEVEAVLREYGIGSTVVAVNDARGRLRMEVYPNNVDEIYRMKEHFEAELMDVVGKRVVIGEKKRSSRGTYVPVEAAATYRYTFGAASRRKKGSPRNGDYGSWFVMEDRVYVLLSDGMGSGEQARRESLRFGGMIEKQIRGGIAPEDAITTAVHSRMLSDGMVYATVDLVEIDLYSGLAYFYKSGAAPSYIKGETVRRIAGGGLYGEKVSVTREVLTEGDLVLMVTDGAEDGRDDSGFISALEKAEVHDVQKLCEVVADRRRRGDRADDDKSVVAIRLEKRTFDKPEQV